VTIGRAVDNLDVGAQRIIAVVALVLCAIGVTSCHKAREPTTLSLPSGERVTLVDAHGDYFIDVDHKQRHVYYVSYYTQHAMEDIPALRQEALRVWAAYKPQIVGTDYDTCVVTPIDAASGAGRPIYLKPDAQGQWHVER